MGLLDWMSTPPASGGYMDQMVNYGMQFGGPQFGVSPDQRANYFKQQELANNLRYQQENPNDQAGIAMRTGQMGQFIAGQQALERQQQGQHWEAQNMSLAQKTSLDQQSQQRKWEQERRSFEWGNLSAGQQAQNALGWAGNAVAQGNLGVAQAGLDLRRQEMQAGQQQAALQRQFPALGLTGQAAMDYRSGVAKMDRAAEVATDVVDYLGTAGTGKNVTDRGTLKAMQSAYQQHIVPAMAQMVGTGTIQQGDMEFIKSVMGDPGAWLSMDNNQKAKVAQILQTVTDERGRLYGLSGVQAPQVKPGGSAWARSRGTVKTPDDIQWGP